MIQDHIASLIAAELPFALTEEQQEAATRLGAFVADPRPERCFALRGYAGTGKTTLVGALVRVLRKAEIPVVLLAPTGRAAKVFSLHAGAPAHTIHRVIYRQETFQGQDTPFQLGFNKLKNAIFIVDEASMIASGTGSYFATGQGDGPLFGSGELLDDLIRFVYEGTGNKLLFVGDTAQLPPVGEEQSPALQRDVLLGYGLLVSGMQLTQVIRQEEQSMVLQNATRIRKMLTGEISFSPEEAAAEGATATSPVPVSFGGEVQRMPGNELIEALYSAYQEYGTDGTIVITRSNKQANIYNNGIRSRILDHEDILCRGDLVMAVKNNYFWTKAASQAEAAAQAAQGKPLGQPLTPPQAPPAKEEVPLRPEAVFNGDVAEVVRFRNDHEQYGFRFADVTLRFPDYDNYELDCRVLLTTLQSESPSLTREEQQLLYNRIMEDYTHIPSKKERFKALREDPYYNAVQIKYAYAVTCHKAQGGQWARVFVDQGYVTEEMMGLPYLRWLYTAFTRTSDRLYLINW